MGYLLRDYDFLDILKKFRQLNYGWLSLALILLLSSHWVRAYRWKTMLEALGYKVSTRSTFYSLMVGYLINLLIPRMGEISRCGFLRKSDGVPFSKSFGTVVSERILDVLLLAASIMLMLFLESQKLYNYFYGIFLEKIESVNSLIIPAISLLIVGLLAAFVILKNLKKVIGENRFLKLKSKLRELIDGLLSIRKVKSPMAFVAQTLLIWIFYFLMTYIMIVAFPSTQNLGLLAGFTTFVIGGIGMAAPIQGGIGTYHLMTSGALAFYEIDKEAGITFATLVHAFFTITVLVIGAASLLLGSFKKRSDARPSGIS